MAQNDTQPLTDEERAELEELRAEKARREAEERARREREELAALRAEKARADASSGPAVKASASAPTAAQPEPKRVPSVKHASKAQAEAPSRDDMTFAQRMVTSEAPKAEDELPGMPPAQKIIIVLALIALVAFIITMVMGQ